MAVLNITFGGTSGDLAGELDDVLADDDIKRIAVEVIRGGEVSGIHIANLADGTFDDFVVDRLRDPDGRMRLYLRPKVPFGILG
jgi:hypothetical protein